MTRHTAIVIFVLCCALVSPAMAAKKMSVQIREGKLRSAPSFVGSVVGTVKYGDRFTVADTQGDWIRIEDENSKIAGWIHKSALSTKRIKLKAGKDNAEVAASSGELALAGKGFNSDVEAEFKSKNKDVDFSWIDKMEKIVVTPAEAAAFLKQGEVAVSKGGAK
ncbi:MAG: SH3 domain-containing protein [Lentisphaerae bacterium]|nr:SH3 domain-containing protein [Lentisphaerota bacterium]